ncbi:YdcH family protein [Ancylobacter dichloromethanicus]
MLPSWNDAIRHWKKQLREEAIRPATDDTRIADLKRRKLILKDEIARLKGATLH